MHQPFTPFHLASLLTVCVLCSIPDAACAHRLSPDELATIHTQPPQTPEQPTVPSQIFSQKNEQRDQQSKKGASLNIEPYTTFNPTAEIRGVEADITTQHSGLSISTRAPITDLIKINASLSFEQSHYDFTDGQLLFPGTTEPFDDLYALSARISFERKLEGNWSMLIGGDLGIAGELDADVGDSILGGGFIGATYARDKNLVISAGIAARTQIEDDPLVAPFAIIRMRIADRARFDTTALPSGFSAAFVAEVNRQMEVSIFTGWQRRQWRLAGGSGRTHDGVFRDEQIPIGVGVTLRTGRHMEVGLRAGILVYRQIEILDSNGVSLRDFETDPSPFITFRVLFRF